MESRGFSPPPPPPPPENKAKRNSETKQTTAAAAAAKATTEGDPTHQVATGKTKQKGSRKEIYQQLHYSKTHGSHLAAAAVADTEDAARCGFFRVSSWRPRAAASQVPKKNKNATFLHPSLSIPPLGHPTPAILSAAQNYAVQSSFNPTNSGKQLPDGFLETRWLRPLLL